MLEIAEWARDLLLSRGALVEAEEDGAVRALVPREIAHVLGSAEWLSLRFGAGAGADAADEWLDRLGVLLPGDPVVTGARLRNAAAVPPFDAEAVLARELVVQNGIYRRVEDCSTMANYCVFTFAYTVESDERSLGVVTVCLNATAQAAVPHAEGFLRALRDDLEEDASVSIAPEEMARLCGTAERAARRDIRRQAVSLEESANRRLARDIARVESYYAGLLAQIQKRLEKRALDPAAAAKERSRALATEADRSTKIEDLVRKYSLRVQIELAGCVLVRVPVREISVRLIRKKQERRRVVHWNRVLGLLDPLLCEACCGWAHPVYLCEQTHCLCKECWAPCPACGKWFCRACQTRCRCGGGEPGRSTTTLY